MKITWPNVSMLLVALWLYPAMMAAVVNCLCVQETAWPPGSFGDVRCGFLTEMIVHALWIANFCTVILILFLLGKSKSQFLIAAFISVIEIVAAAVAGNYI